MLARKKKRVVADAQRNHNKGGKEDSDSKNLNDSLVKGQTGGQIASPGRNLWVSALYGFTGYDQNEPHPAATEERFSGKRPEKSPVGKRKVEGDLRQGKTVVKLDRSRTSSETSEARKHLRSGSRRPGREERCLSDSCGRPIWSHINDLEAS